MNKSITRIALMLLLLGCGGAAKKNPHVIIDTSEGDIEMELFPAQAPKTVVAFLSYVDAGYYNKGAFYRVLLTEGLSSASNTGLVQGGTWQTSDANHPPVPGIPHEPTTQTGLSHTSGTASLARREAGTGSTEFFICIGDQTQFDKGNGSPSDGLGFAAFGRIVSGMKVVRAIQQKNKNGESLQPPVVINSIERN